jgi:outer membrane protein TolC
MYKKLRSNKQLTWACLALVTTSSTFTGCTGVKEFSFSDSWNRAPSYHNSIATQIEYPSVKSCLAPAIVSSPAPHSLENPSDLPTVDLTLQEAVQRALAQSDILRTLGGSVVQAPQGFRSNFDPALTESNPLGGVSAALSAFDAQVTSQLFWQVNDRPNNVNPAFVNGVIGQQFQRSAFQETAATMNYGISKTTGTGASFAARHNFGYSLPNTPNRQFTGAYTGFFEAEYRQPLLFGGGVESIQIAGPNPQFGQYNGVLIARINTDISLADFEAGIITFINDVETAYWELYFAYHNLEAQVAGRNSSLLTWQRIKELQNAGARGGDAAAEAQARSQYYQFDVQVKEALTGATGLYTSEQNLRYLLGMPPSDGGILKPVSDPMEGEVVFEWDSALGDALTRRVEVRRQKWNIKRRELEMIAARLNRRPQLDFLGQYRYRGLGDALIDSRDPIEPFNSLYQSIFEGDYQEWQAGLELSHPVGFRRAGAAIANARWNLAREQALLKEQELRISHDLSNAARRIQRAFALMESNYNRQSSDADQVEALQARYEGGLDNINFLLQAQQQLAVSQTAYFRSLVDYQLALRDLHREKGSLLSYNQVGLSEGAWPAEAQQSAIERGRFFAPRASPEKVEVPRPVSEGGFDPMQVGNYSSALPMAFEGVGMVPTDAAFNSVAPQAEVDTTVNLVE